LVDVTDQNPSWIGAAGELVSTTRDLDVFLAALQRGRLLPPALQAQMRRFRREDPDAEYGLGLSRIGFRPGCAGVGHDGIVPGYNTFMFANEHGRRVIMSVTEGRADHNSPAVLAAEFTAVAVALCR
jgi:D-alanyl-D-alanine carboxypeptidase